VQWWNKLAGRQAAAMALSCELPLREPSLGVKRILMMDFASAPAHAKGVAPTAGCEEGHAEAAVTRPLKASPPPTIDRVDKMYHQLAEIHTIAAA
jgi:hypothetical protein